MDKLLSDILTAKKVNVKNITGIDATRLYEMGITPGTEIVIVRRAPLGFPIEIKVRGYFLSLRKSEADCIEVEVIK
jgi:Fe2+ transport system protein FeoA